MKCKYLHHVSPSVLRIKPDYLAFDISHRQNESTAFVEYMLSVIDSSLDVTMRQQNMPQGAPERIEVFIRHFMSILFPVRITSVIGLRYPQQAQAAIYDTRWTPGNLTDREIKARPDTQKSDADIRASFPRLPDTNTSQTPDIQNRP